MPTGRFTKNKYLLCKIIVLFNVGAKWVSSVRRGPDAREWRMAGTDNFFFLLFLNGVLP